MYNFLSRGHFMPVLSLLFWWAFGGVANAQLAPCENHPLFNSLPQHKVVYCEQREFGQLLVRTLQGNAYDVLEEKHSGELLETTYDFTGDWNKRPTALQLFQNYKKAVSDAGGKVLYERGGSLYLHLPKGSSNYWIWIQTDNSGQYTLRTLRESAMEQQIMVLSAAQIEKEMALQGRAICQGIFFDTDKAVIKPESEEALKQMAAYLKAHPKVKVFIVGHTDNTGGYEHNMKLSGDRAEAVLTALHKNHSIPMERMQAAGAGPISPVAENTSEAGRQRNRRVELVLK
jgi:outer membrane protein OmpA-like peptidoglycan-associated protein